MFKLLFKYVIPLVLLLTAGIVGYNYYFGTPDEQQNSQQIIDKVTGLGSDIFELLSSEADKFEDGKYDNAIDKIGASLSYLKDQAATLADQGSQYLEQLNSLEGEKEQLEQALARMKEDPGQFAAESPANAGRSRTSSQMSEAEIQNRINELAKQTEQLALQMAVTRN